MSNEYAKKYALEDCDECDGTGVVTVANGPDDFDEVYCPATGCAGDKIAEKKESDEAEPSQD